MTAMFPSSGVPAADAKNSLPDPDTVNCDELWYSTSRCTPRFDPAAANAQLAELINLINKGGVKYDCTKLDQVQLAVRYLTQRGLMSATGTTGGPNDYSGILDPVVMPSYNNLMTIRIVPNVNNALGARLQLNGLGFALIVRNDGVQIQPNDLKAGMPVELIYYNGWWWYVGLAPSQVPNLKQNLILYVNWNIGNDANDGTENVAGKALKTPQRAIDIAFSYPPSQFTITIMIADSLEYAGFNTPRWAGPNLQVIGNTALPQNVLLTGQNTHAVTVQGINTMNIFGITVATTLNAAGPGGGFVATSMGSIQTAQTRSNYCCGAVFEAAQGNIAIVGDHTFNGDCGEMYWTPINGALGWQDGVQQIIARPITVGYAALANTGGNMSMSSGPVFVGAANVTGTRYLASLNGTINTQGKGPTFFPGTIAGFVQTGGQYA
jgi:hypothetical protein